MAANENVPYFVRSLDDEDDSETTTTAPTRGRTKAIFTVPKELASQLAVHPILCRGSCFELQVDEQSPKSGNSKTAFLSTVFCSPRPQDLALELSKRIAVRMDHMDQFQVKPGGGSATADARSLLGL